VPNGGSSLRDDVTVIRQKVDAQDTTLAAHGELLSALGDTLHALNGRLDALPTSNPKGGA
jgi:hypothetical protein